MKGVIERLELAARAAAGVIARPSVAEIIKVSGFWQAWNWDPEGRLKWYAATHNTIVTVGYNEILDQFFGGSGYTAALYVGLKDTGAVNAADEMDSHAGWATITPYSNATDPAFTVGSAAAGSIDNSASKASFTINAADTIYGAFLKSGDDTKGGTSGVLISAADFSVARALDDGDTLDVQITYSFS